MVQIIDRSPSFGSQLAQVLGQAGVNVAEGFAQRRSNQADERILQEFGNNPNLTPLQQIQAFAKLSPNKQQALSPLFGQYMKTQGVQQVANQKAQADQAAKEEEKKGTAESLNWLEDNIGYTGNTKIPFAKSFQGEGAGLGLPALNREAFEKREEFDRLSFWETDKAFTNINKGVLNEVKFEYVKDKLAPNSKLSERENKARINSLRRIQGIGRETSVNDQKKIIKSEFKKLGIKEPTEKEQQEFQKPKQASPGKTWMLSPSGKQVQIPNDQVQAALANKGKLL